MTLHTMEGPGAGGLTEEEALRRAAAQLLDAQERALDRLQDALAQYLKTEREALARFAAVVRQ